MEKLIDPENPQPTLATLSMLGAIIQAEQKRALDEAKEELANAIEDTLEEAAAKEICDYCGKPFIFTKILKTDQTRVFGTYQVQASCDCDVNSELEIDLSEAYHIIALKLYKGDQAHARTLVRAWEQHGLLKK